MCPHRHTADFFRKTLRTTDFYHSSEIIALKNVGYETKQIKSSKLTISFENIPILGSSFDSVKVVYNGLSVHVWLHTSVV